MPVKIVPNSIVYYENIDFAELVDRPTETWESTQWGHNFSCNHTRKAKYYCNKAFNPIVGSIYHNSAIKIPNVVKQVQVVQTIFFTLMIIIRHQTLTWNWTITTYTQWFFGIKFAFLCLLHICRNACAKAELCKNNKNVLLWWKRINGILLPKFFWPNVRKNCSSDREKNLKFEAEGREFAKILRSLEQFVRTVKGQNNFW